MKAVDIKRVRFYLWVSLLFIALWSFSEYHRFPDGTFYSRVVNSFWRTAYLVVINYILFEYTIPFISRRRKSIVYNILIAIPLVFLHMMFYSYGAYLWRSMGVAMGIFTPLGSFKSIGHAVSNGMAFSMASFVVFGVARYVNEHNKLKRAAQQLRMEKQAAELNYLKSQTNPHFLFNTLNNIYALSRQKSDLAPESILRLSKILRFMLYETSGNFIAIEQELKIISDYIELEKLRYDETLRVNFNYNISDMKQALPPLLLIPLVENAFKHGASETRMNPYVDIHLTVRDSQLTFEVKNSADNATAEVKENIGLTNLRRQLELLYKDYSLSVQPGRSEFTAVLKINLLSHV